jgi:hypothetical protein
MGTDRRETYIAESCISGSANVDRKVPYPEELGHDPGQDIVTDIIAKISFLPRGEFSLQTDSMPRLICNGDDELLQIDTKDLDDNDSEGSRSRNIARGILAFYRDRTPVQGSRAWPTSMPLITLIGN